MNFFRYNTLRYLDVDMTEKNNTLSISKDFGRAGFKIICKVLLRDWALVRIKAV